MANATLLINTYDEMHFLELFLEDGKIFFDQYFVHPKIVENLHQKLWKLQYKFYGKNTFQ